MGLEDGKSNSGEVGVFPYLSCSSEPELPLRYSGHPGLGNVSRASDYR